MTAGCIDRQAGSPKGEVNLEGKERAKGATGQSRQGPRVRGHEHHPLCLSPLPGRDERTTWTSWAQMQSQELGSHFLVSSSLVTAERSAVSASGPSMAVTGGQQLYGDAVTVVLLLFYKRYVASWFL